ncbi:MAG: hypothetical protein ABI779_08955 [Acidobacteriota bacterium]
MVDNVNPTSQFHPYQPQDAVPNSEKPAPSILGGILGKLGMDQSKIDSMGGSLKNMDVRGQIDKARGMAQKNPGLVLGGLAALVIGAGLMRKRSAR